MKANMKRTLLIFLALLQASIAEFNFEVGLRVHDKLTEYMSTPANILDFVSNYRSNEALRTPDRNSFVQLGDALMKSYPHWMIYYGLETGELAGVFHTPRHGNYREPGDGAYEVVMNDDDGDVFNNVNNSKHYMTCVDEKGSATPCLMKPGEKYINCIDGCSLKRCEDEDSQRDCSLVNDQDQTSCEANTRWCKSYDIQDVTEEDGPRGFVPLSYYCLGQTGLPTQEPGKTYEFHDAGPGNCYYSDGVTQVDQHMSGQFNYCGIESAKIGSPFADQGAESCDTTFIGVFLSSNYDPRYRPWYIMAKQLQKPYWTSAFMFWESTDMGITFVTPIYGPDETGRNVFEGVLALDYKFTDIGKFLGSSYEESDTVIVAIVEEASPHYVIATSTGGIGAKTVLASDNAQPCETDSPGCVSVRIMSSELDNAISEAFAVQIEAGFPETDLLPAVFDDVVYATQTKPFSLPSDGVNWRIMILSPIETLSQDAIEHNDSLVAFIIAPSILGFIVCAIFFVLFMMKRKTREVINSDYRFTGAFILNCCLLNLACLSFMGGNTDELCLLRMWLVHFFFVVTLAPLLVKTYRMYMLVGKPGLRRHKISHVKTALMMVPFILIEVAILLIFTFVDPSKETSLIEQDASTVTYRVVCTHETIAFATVQLAYEGAILLVGCFLAYKTRNMVSSKSFCPLEQLCLFYTLDIQDHFHNLCPTLHQTIRAQQKDDFGECKQLLLAMYNIALIASIIIVLAYVAELYGKLRILVTVGVCWSTIFSSGVFVLPRLLQVQQSSSTASRSHPSSFDRRGSVSDIRERLAIRESNLSSQQTIGLDSVKEAEEADAKPGKESEKEFQECETISGP
eukprot:CAMPEP_0201632718 /NCGR_PEP_ID=MMETSP0493-20130528/6263_1 /ASSEMBLY_ACC=CAM_ASM_000838 /TAXON_ID=420259 /ORGANISM="Thalassiosira gravida, Strain GMp14c1" /LENGTH=851 /DNA_ID=CAMNT_0048104293 /DNA_START=624 /DNA_END=3179 /DNA_ORIENTATION=-